MSVYKKIIFLIAFLVSVFALEKPVTAFAEFLGSHTTTLQGNWGSSGVNDAPILRFSPNDNPEYACQWQIYDEQIFLDEEGKKHQKVSWAWFTFDKNSTYFGSKKLDWTVARVYSDDTYSLDRDALVKSITNETSLVPNLPEQYVYFGFEPGQDLDQETYQVTNYISLKQKIGDLIVGGYSSKVTSRDQSKFFNIARVDVRVDSEPWDEQSVYPLNSQLHCEKIN
jgi:hypothetical protein